MVKKVVIPKVNEKYTLEIDGDQLSCLDCWKKDLLRSNFTKSQETLSVGKYEVSVYDVSGWTDKVYATLMDDILYVYDHLQGAMVSVGSKGKPNKLLITYGDKRPLEATKSFLYWISNYRLNIYEFLDQKEFASLGYTLYDDNFCSVCNRCLASVGTSHGVGDKKFCCECYDKIHRGK